MVIFNIKTLCGHYFLWNGGALPLLVCMKVALSFSQLV